jgi:hypothetical protein
MITILIINVNNTLSIVDHDEDSAAAHSGCWRTLECGLPLV